MMRAALAGALRELSWRRVAAVAAMALAWSLVLIATQTGYFTEGVPFTPSLNAVLSMQLNGLAVLFMVLVADEASPPARPRWWPYVIAVPAGVLVGTSALYLVSQHVFHLTTAYRMQGAADAFVAFFFRHGTHALIVCGMAAFVYAGQRRAAGRAAALREIQRERLEGERHLVEARLSAARARLEPQFVMRTLADVEGLYQRNPRKADWVLKELTAYLRATIPEIREPSSTIATEIRIANAFLNVMALRSRERLRLVAGEALASNARMPPLVLLPLAQHALAADPDASLTLELARTGGGVVLTMRDAGPAFAPRSASVPVVREVRERLQALHGAMAGLTLQDDAPGSAATIEFPLVTTSASPPARAEHMSS